MRTTLAAIVLVCVFVLPQSVRAADDAPSPRQGATHAVPLYGEIVAAYDAPPDDPYAPGHRGVDVSAPTASPVRASADGTVSFAGTVVGNLTVTVDHADGILTSYSYLGSKSVEAGRAVRRGEVIGTLGRGHDDSLPPHVHLAARRDGAYFDPLELYLGSSYADLLRLVG
jgi:murein DD-endopeptidase MepM/ murein hydrolase activator NlpD